MKQCQFCAEEIKYEAEFCLHCKKMQVDVGNLADACWQYHLGGCFTQWLAVFGIGVFYFIFTDQPSLADSWAEICFSIGTVLFCLALAMLSYEKFKKLPVPRLLEKLNDYRKAYYWVSISWPIRFLIICYLIVQLNANVPSKRDFSRFLRNHTELAKEDIIWEAEGGVCSSHVVKDLDSKKHWYIGVWGAFYYLDDDLDYDSFLRLKNMYERP